MPIFTGRPVPIIMGVKGELKQIDVDGSRKIEPTMAHGFAGHVDRLFPRPDQAVILARPDAR